MTKKELKRLRALDNKARDEFVKRYGVMNTFDFLSDEEAEEYQDLYSKYLTDKIMTKKLKNI